MINFNGINYEDMFNIFWDVIKEYHKNDNKEKVSIFNTINGKFYRIVAHKYQRYSVVNFITSDISDDGCLINKMNYCIVSDSNNYVKEKQSPPIVNPTEFINEIINKLNIKDIVESCIDRNLKTSLILSQL